MTETKPPARPLALLDAIARRIADVSPAWREVVRMADNDSAARAALHEQRLGRARALGVELIREGWLLHRGRSRVTDGASDHLALLMGDWCYAAGLCAIADDGSLDDVARLARLIADVSVLNDDAAAVRAWSDAESDLAMRG